MSNEAAENEAAAEETAITLPGPIDQSGNAQLEASQLEALEAPQLENAQLEELLLESVVADTAETADADAPVDIEQAENPAASYAETDTLIPIMSLPFTARVPLIAGNWKMNLDHLQAIAHVQKISWALKDAKHDFASVEVAVFPPFTDLRSVQTLLSADRLPLTLGAQDVSAEAPGAFTGDIAAAFLAKLETRYVLVGHSERRHGHGEGDALIGAKAKAVAAAGMVPLICVGETAEDLETQGAAAVPLAQLEAALSTLPSGAEFVIAYEPVWAIGSGAAASPEQAQDVCRVLRLKVAELRGEDVAVATRVLYGGSVTSENVASFLRQADIDGALIGGASLSSEEFTRIARFRNHVTA